MADELLRALCALATVFVPLAVAGAPVYLNARRARRDARSVGQVL